jgi:pyruvate-ferredoxin/flavodoxin oxidoreductase
MLMSGKPIKVLVVDTQVYSNTGGQACTSGFIGQVSDMAPYGSAMHGKSEIRKEMSLLGMAHRSSFVLQSTIAHTTHLLEGFIDGLNARRPALFNIYAVCPPEHGVGDDKAVDQSKLAVESRAYPLFRFDPDVGSTFSEGISLEGNPSPDTDWPTYPLHYADETGAKQTMDLPVTFADFAASEGRFAKQFRKAPAETWNDNMLPLAELLQLPADERVGRFPYIWALDGKNRLMRLIVAEELVRASEERLQFWHQLKDIAAVLPTPVDEAAVAERVRAELMQRISASLGLGAGSVKPVPALPAPQAAAPVAAAAAVTAPAAATPSAAPIVVPSAAPIVVPAVAPATAAVTADAADGYEPCWIDSPECSACDECTALAPGAFAYNGQRQAVVVNPKGAKFADLVKCAEKCTAGCLHPGTPWNPAEPNLEKLRKRAAKYN